VPDDTQFPAAPIAKNWRYLPEARSSRVAAL